MVIPRLPPSVTLLIGLIVGLAIGSVSSYFIVVERLDAELANAERDTVIEGEKRSSLIRKETAAAKKQSEHLKNEVKNGERSIVTTDNKRFTDSYVTRMQSKVSRARALAD